MILSIACAVFLLVGGSSWYFHTRVPKWLFRNLEYFLIGVSFIGVLVALAQASAAARTSDALKASERAREIFGAMLYGVEHRLDRCDVWWNVTLNQTNRNPAACQVSEECRNTCRMAHFVTQYRWRPIDTTVGQWDTFQNLLCSAPATEHFGATIQGTPDPLCEPATKFIDSLREAQRLRENATHQPLAATWILVLVQILLAIGFGLELGKLRSSRNQADRNN